MFPPIPISSAHPELSPLSLARMLWKSRALIGLVWAFLTLLAGAAVYMIPPTYRAEAVILVDGQKVPERYVASTVNADVQDRLATITQQILASSRLQRIIDSYHLYQRERRSLPQEEIIEQMRSDTKVTLEHGWGQERTSAFRIAYQGRDAATAAEVANQIGNLFIEENLRTRENHAEGTSAFIEEQLEQAKKTLRRLKHRLKITSLNIRANCRSRRASLAGALSRAQIELQANQDAINRAGQSKALLSHLAQYGRIDRQGAGALGGDAGLVSFGTRPTLAPLRPPRNCKRNWMRCACATPRSIRMSSGWRRWWHRRGKPRRPRVRMRFQRDRLSTRPIQWCRICCSSASASPACAQNWDWPATNWICAPPGGKRFWPALRLCKAAWIRCPCGSSS